MLTAVQPSSPLLSRPQSSHSIRQQFSAAASSPKPSPTKRAHSSPSPTLSSHEFDHSPRVSRTKLSDHRDHPRRRSTTSPVVIDLSEEEMAVMREHARRVPQPLVGLGVALEHQEPATKPPQDDEEPPQPLVSALEQSRKLATMPIELSSALSRLSSQHHYSEYNNLKRTIAASLASPVPNPSTYCPRLANLPQSTPLAQRSQSNPPSTQQRIPEARATTPVRALSGRSVPLWSSLVNFRQPESNARDSPVREGSRSVPPLSRAATPPPRPASNIPDIIQSTLTPNLVNLAFSPDPSPQSGLAAEVTPRVDVAVALDDALKSTLDRTRPRINSARTAVSPLPTPCTTPPVTFIPGMQIIDGFAVKTSASHPMNISPILPPDFLTLLASNLFAPSSSKPRAPLMPSAAISVNSSSTPSIPAPPRPFLLAIPSSCDLWALTSTFPSPGVPTPLAAATPPTAPRTFGNFLLSSCPGKKVRLGAQPARGGRQGICRDLKMDLQRAKDEGVKLIICCLDDQELGYLGAPWDEYSRAAHALSLSVIRVPMMEGFAPQSPSALDAHLSHIIRTHTLRGESVLAHCRGGIGRAGLVACCWMVKCGLVGLDLEVEGEEERRREAMRVVEKVIDIVRKRRSVKAIETPHQVHFLLDYVSFLQAQATLLRAADA